MRQPPWKYRRRAIFGSMLASLVILAYVMVRWDDTSLAQTLALGAYGLMGTVTAAYVGGAAYEDTRLWKSQPQDDEEASGEALDK